MSRTNVFFDAFPDSVAETGDFGTDGKDCEPFDMHFTLWPEQKNQVCRNPVMQHRLAEKGAFQAECLAHEPTEPVTSDCTIGLV